MLSLQDISKRLSDRNLQVVSKATKVSYNTLKSMRDDPNSNPRYENLKAVSDYFEAQEIQE